MKTYLLTTFIVVLAGCSTTKHLEMDPEVDLSALPSKAQCWLVDFEDVCISLSTNEGFSDLENLEVDVKRVAVLMKDITSDERDAWYTRMSDTEQRRLHGLILAISIHYGVKHFVDV